MISKEFPSIFTFIPFVIWSYGSLQIVQLNY